MQNAKRKVVRETDHRKPDTEDLLANTFSMTRVEQHKMIETLRDYSQKMRGRDLDEFEMMRKRDRDDEELDQLSRKRLTDLYNTYVPERFR